MMRFFRAIRPAASATSRPSAKDSSNVSGSTSGSAARSNGANRFRLRRHQGAIAAHLRTPVPPRVGGRSENEPTGRR